MKFKAVLNILVLATLITGGNFMNNAKASDWDKTFAKSDKVNIEKVKFKNRYGIELVGDLYMPKDKPAEKLPAIAVSGPFGAVKEQASGLYAQTMAGRGFITLAFDPSYTGESGGEPRLVALVGKGLTFDSGGISLKPAKGMDEMKYDMCGAAAMIASIATAAAMKLPVNIVAAVGFTENMPGSSATKPGDILKSYAGKTVEVLNTDAEGRLVLCDVLAYTIDKFKPKCVVDAATLTGACVVALGNDIAGLFSNDEELAMSLMMAGDTAMDPVWRMPLDISFTKALKSNFADLANISDSRGAGACTAAAFLEEFVGDTPWAHLDIAGVANKSGKEKGSTGRPVPLLINFLKDQAK